MSDQVTGLPTAALSQPDAPGMTGVDIASTIATVVSSLAPLLVRALDLGSEVDPTLERQLRSAMEVANSILLDADAAFQAMDKATDERLK